MKGKSNAHAREIAYDILGENVFWNWDCEHLFIDILIEGLISPSQCLGPEKDITITLEALRSVIINV